MGHDKNKQIGKQGQEKRSRKVTFRLSPSEYAQISEDVTVCGLTVSSLALKRLPGVRVAYHADLAVLSELRRLGGLLRHIHNGTRGPGNGVVGVSKFAVQNAAHAYHHVMARDGAAYERASGRSGENNLERT